MVNKLKAEKEQVTVGSEPTYGSNAADTIIDEVSELTQESVDKVISAIKPGVEMPPGRILFVCDNATNRSPEFAKYFNKTYKNDYIAKFAGIDAYNDDEQLNESAIFWADAIFSMDIEQVMYIKEHYPAAASKVWLVGVSDHYASPGKALDRVILFWDKYMFTTYNSIRQGEYNRKYAEDQAPVLNANDVAAAVSDGINVTLADQDYIGVDVGDKKDE